MLERINLERDILKRLDGLVFDKNYKEHHDHLDAQELDKEVDDAFIQREGDEFVDDDTKALNQRKLKFKLMTRQFF
jgi:hypothetical protein